MSQNHGQRGWLERLVRWFFGAPFGKVPPELGDPVPPDLRAFEAQAEAAQHHSIGRVAADLARRDEPKH